MDCFVATLPAMTAQRNDLLLVIDEGTTSTRAMLFDAGGACLATEQRELAQSYPQPGWVEHDAEEIWASSLACARAAVAARRRGGADRGARDHQPARDDRLLEPADGAGAGSGDRLAGPAHGGSLRPAEGRGA